MTQDDLKNLLVESEGDHLDWKANPPADLELPARENAHQEARGEMLKDIQALANAEGPIPRYLVWGVADNVSPRRVKPFKQSKGFDDAKFQDWVKNAIEPNLKFNYVEVDWEEEYVVGVFKIYPEVGQTYIAKSDVGGVLHKGQVWYRKSSQNNVATLEQLKKFFTDTGIQLTLGFIDKWGNYNRTLRIARRNQSDLDLQKLYYRKQHKVLEKFHALQELTQQQKRVSEASQLLEEQSQSFLESIGNVKLSQNDINIVTNFLNKLGATYTRDVFEFSDLIYGINLGPLLGGQQVIRNEKDKERYYLFWEVVEAIEEAEHDISEETRVWAYTPIRFAIQNIGQKSAYKLEVEISPTGDATRLNFYDSVPSKKPTPVSQPDIYNLTFDPFAKYEAHFIPQYKQNIEHLPPKGIKEIGEVAISPSNEGIFQFNAIIKGQDISEPLEFLLEIEVKTT